MKKPTKLTNFYSCYILYISVNNYSVQLTRVHNLLQNKLEQFSMTIGCQQSPPPTLYLLGILCAIWKEEGHVEVFIYVRCSVSQLVREGKREKSMIGAIALFLIGVVPELIP